MGNVKRKYIIRAYYADPHKKEYYKVITGNDFILFVYKLFLRIFYDYIDVDIRYI